MLSACWALRTCARLLRCGPRGRRTGRGGVRHRCTHPAAANTARAPAAAPSVWQSGLRIVNSSLLRPQDALSRLVEVWQQERSRSQGQRGPHGAASRRARHLADCVAGNGCMVSATARGVANGGHAVGRRRPKRSARRCTRAHARPPPTAAGSRCGRSAATLRHCRAPEGGCTCIRSARPTWCGGARRRLRAWAADTAHP